ncbi:MAG: phosphatase PAP2 family protein [Nocardiaceae bacterium]|nr:phosphatase PAP2 family protein [Nocardiaceae bacterium]
MRGRDIRTVQVSLMLLAAVAIAVNTDSPIVSFDESAGAWSKENVPHTIVWVAHRLFRIGNPETFMPLTLGTACAIVWLQRSVMRGVLAIATVGFAGAASSILKEILSSYRAGDYAAHFHTFPSTHTTVTTTLLGVIAVCLFEGRRSQGRALVAAGSGGLLIGVAAFLIAAHWPSDVMGGLLLATAVVATFRLILRGR